MGKCSNLIAQVLTFWFHSQSFSILILASRIFPSRPLDLACLSPPSSPLSTSTNNPSSQAYSQVPLPALSFIKGQGHWKTEGYDPSPLHTSLPNDGPSARQDPLPRVPDIHCPPRLCRLILFYFCTWAKPLSSTFLPLSAACTLAALPPPPPPLLSSVQTELEL